MRILIVAATALEIDPLVAAFGEPIARSLRLDWYSYADHDLHVLRTGVGMVATAAWCSRTLAQSAYDLALNLGICGSFDRSLRLADTVHVIADRLAELGAEDGDRFLSIEELALPDEDDGPLALSELINAAPPTNAALDALPQVNGITVNTVHGNERTIAAVVERLNPQVESMEGAAFMYANMIHGVPFAQVRAVSNYVETRNRGAWQITDAIQSLAAATLRILDTL